MKKETIAAKVPGKDGNPDLIGAVEKDWPETIEEAKKLGFTEDAILSNALSNWTVTLQGNMRAGLKRGEDSAALQARLGGAVMGVAVKGAKVDPVQAYLAKFASATPEEQKKMLGELQARAAKK